LDERTNEVEFFRCSVGAASARIPIAGSETPACIHRKF
jgi:hypothetical protein